MRMRLMRLWWRIIVGVVVMVPQGRKLVGPGALAGIGTLGGMGVVATVTIIIITIITTSGPAWTGMGDRVGRYLQRNCDNDGN